MSSGVASGVTLEQFAAEHSVELTRFAFLLCADRQRAEDLAQDALLALYRRFGEVITVDSPLAYARKTVLNAYLSARHKRAAAEVVCDELPQTSVMFDVGETADMWRALQRLPQRQRAALVLRYWLDLPDGDIADILGCRGGTVRSLLSRGLASLRHSELFEELT